MIAVEQLTSVEEMRTNPFSTRFVAARTRFRGEAGFDLSAVARRFNGLRFSVAQVVGRHGSGKTTFCRALEEHLKERFEEVVYISVRSSAEIRRHARVCAAKKRRTLYVVDGVERLSWLSRCLLIAHCLRSRNGLLMTTHRRQTGVPVLFETSPRAEVFHSIVNDLQDGHPLKLERQVVDNAFAVSNGDIREALMKLYDEYEMLRT